MADTDNSVQTFYEKLDSLYQTGDIGGVLSYILKLKEHADNTGGADEPEATPLTLAVYSELGSYYKAVSQYAEAVEAHLMAGRLTEEILGADTEDYAVNLLNIAGTYRLWGKMEEAEKYFFESKELFEKIGATHDFYYASVLNNIGLFYQDKGGNRLAVQYIEQSIAILREMKGVEIAVATALTNLASLYHKLLRTKDADKAIDSALELYHGLPPNPHLAAALQAKAMMLFQDGQYASAKENFTQALDITEQFYGQNVEYAIACESLAAVSGKLGETAEAKGWLEKAAAIFDRIYGADNERSRRIAAQLDGLGG